MCRTQAGHTLVVNPTGIVAPPQPRTHLRPHPPAGALPRGLLVVDNLIPGMSALAEALRTRWQARFDAPVRVVRVPHSRPTTASLLDDLARSGLAVLGLGNCGACTTWLAELAADLAPRMPVAVLVTDRFAAIARTRLAALGEAALPVAVVADEAAHTSQQQLGPAAEEALTVCAAAWQLPPSDRVQR